MIHLANGYDFYWVNLILFAMFIVGSLIAGYAFEHPSLLNKKILFIPIDKLAHFTLSFLLCLGFGIIQNGKPIWLIVLVPLLIGLLKEVYDYVTKKKIDVKDILADLSGIAVAIAIVI